ncbi:MAG: pirin family protein [Candidatus Margulisiibacteriota bacterium]
MSYFNCPTPDDQASAAFEHVETVILPRLGDIGNFQVHRALPAKDRQMVGPFIFWDQMGPGEFITGSGLDVRPHPHIGLSTLTYLFKGEVQHQDSLGTNMVIKPGEMNLMTAGNGIVHSERTPQPLRQHDSALFGIQSWLALPKHLEDCTPTFTHTATLPQLQDTGTRITLITGQLLGEKAPTPFPHETLYADITLEPGSKLCIPAEVEERALYILSGDLDVAGYRPTAPDQPKMIVLKPQKSVDVTAHTHVRFMLLGGAAMDGPRHIWWNLVASDKDRIEDAKKRWKAQQFPKIPTDLGEFIPLPGE